MTSIIELKTAKYKDVEFLYTDMPTTGGNRLIKFNFPGSDKQAIERQGKAPRTFNMTAIIPHNDYYQQRDNLLRVLEDGESGTLTHPTFGDVENVINGIYTLTEKLTELGRAQIVITFEVNDSSGIPQQSAALASQVQAQSDILNTQLETNLAAAYEVNTNFFGNFSDALDNLGEIPDVFTDALEFAAPATSLAADFSAAINRFAGGIGSLIQAPADFASTVRELFEDLNNLYDAPETLLGAFKLLFPFGEDDPEVETTTVGLVQRKKNRDVVRTNLRTQALSYAYLNSAQIDFETTEDLDLVQDLLEAQYVDIRENQLITNEALEELDRLRVQTQKSLDVSRVNARSIITINTPLMPLTTLVFSFYGSTELVNIIADLNNIKQNAFVEGDIKVLAA